MTDNEILKFMKNAHGEKVSEIMQKSIDHNEDTVKDFFKRMDEYINNSDKDELEAKEEFLELDKTDLFKYEDDFNKQINNSK